MLESGYDWPSMPGGFKHILVAVDKFTKWIVYKPIVKISLDREVISSPIFYIGLVSVTPSSHIWVPISPLNIFGIYVKTPESRSSTHPWPIQRPMVKWNMSMGWYSMDQKRELIAIPRKVGGRFKSYLMWSGDCELSLAKLQDIIRSSLHMDQKSYTTRKCTLRNAPKSSQ